MAEPHQVVWMVVDVAPVGDQQAICVCASLDQAEYKALTCHSWYCTEILESRLDGSGLEWVDWDRRAAAARFGLDEQGNPKTPRSDDK